MTAPISVVIPTCNRSLLLARTLQSLAECGIPSDYAETIVIENGSKEGAESIVAGAPDRLRARYLFHPIGNKSAALNAVLKPLRDHLLVFLDDDVRVSPCLLMEYSRAAAHINTGLFFGGPMGVDYESPPPEWLIPYLPHSAVGWSLPASTERIDRPVFLGCNWAAFGNDLVSRGGFDETIGPGALSQSVGQDTAMQRALLEGGILGMYLQQARVWHWVPHDRCSATWALKRGYRHAIRAGMDFRDQCPSLFGVPRWLVRRLVQQYCITAAKRFSLDAHSRFAARWEYMQLRGLADGIRFARNVRTHAHTQYNA